MHVRKYASDVRAFFPTANQQPKSSLLVEKQADTPAEYVLVDSESDPKPPVDERVPGTVAHTLGSLVATEEVVTESPIMHETISLKSATNKKVAAMPLETYHKALEQLKLSMSSLKLDILSQDVLSADRPIEEGPTPQDAEDELAEPLDLLEDIDEGSSDEPYHVALTRHLNRLLGLEKKSKTLNAKRLIELTMLSDYNNLRQAFVKAECKSPSMLASNRIAKAKFVPTAKKPNYQYKSWYARHIRAKANYLVRVGSLPESKQGKGGVHYSLLAKEDVRRGILSYVRTLKTGQISPMRLRREVNHKLLPELGIAKSISESTARQWLLKLGYRPIKHSKGMYIDGHERSDVIKYWSSFLNSIKAMQPFIQQYDDNTDEPILLILPDGEKRHVPVAHDKSCFHANDRDALIWVKEGEQELRQKGRGHIIHTSDFLTEEHS